MNFLKRLFNPNPASSTASLLGEGDLFYSVTGNQYQVYKLLKKTSETWHVLSYQQVPVKPETLSFDQLQINEKHIALEVRSLRSPVLLQTSYVSDDELSGYYEYLKDNSRFEELAIIANTYFSKAYRSTDDQKHEDAVYFYTQCIRIAPVYWEAIDNRAFAQMDLGNWEEAIADFKLSLDVNRANMLAIFSIGECLFRLNRLSEAKTQFEYVLKYDPDNQAAIEFLERTEEMMMQH